ncbi:unnamed protein product [Gordionus sp. m RMFG-2023]
MICAFSKTSARFKRTKIVWPLRNSLNQITEEVDLRLRGRLTTQIQNSNNNVLHFLLKFKRRIKKQIDMVRLEESGLCSQDSTNFNRNHFPSISSKNDELLERCNSHRQLILAKWNRSSSFEANFDSFKKMFILSLDQTIEYMDTLDNTYSRCISKLIKMEKVVKMTYSKKMQNRSFQRNNKSRDEDNKYDAPHQNGIGIAPSKLSNYLSSKKINIKGALRSESRLKERSEHDSSYLFDGKIKEKRHKFRNIPPSHYYESQFNKNLPRNKDKEYGHSTPKRV